MKLHSFYTKFLASVLVFTFLFTNSVAYSDAASVTSAFKDLSTVTPQFFANSAARRSELRKLLGIESGRTEKIASASRSELRSNPRKMSEVYNLRLVLSTEDDVEEVLLRDVIPAIEQASIQRPVRLAIVPATEDQAKTLVDIYKLGNLELRGSVADYLPGYAYGLAYSHNGDLIRLTLSKLFDENQAYSFVPHVVADIGIEGTVTYNAEHPSKVKNAPATSRSEAQAEKRSGSDQKFNVEYFLNHIPRISDQQAIDEISRHLQGWTGIHNLIRDVSRLHIQYPAIFSFFFAFPDSSEYLLRSRKLTDVDRKLIEYRYTTTTHAGDDLPTAYELAHSYKKGGMDHKVAGRELERFVNRLLEVISEYVEKKAANSTMPRDAFVFDINRAGWIRAASYKVDYAHGEAEWHWNEIIEQGIDEKNIVAVYLQEKSLNPDGEIWISGPHEVIREKIIELGELPVHTSILIFYYDLGRSELRTQKSPKEFMPQWSAKDWGKFTAELTLLAAGVFILLPVVVLFPVPSIVAALGYGILSDYQARRDRIRQQQGSLQPVSGIRSELRSEAETQLPNKADLLEQLRPFIAGQQLDEIDVDYFLTLLAEFYKSKGAGKDLKIGENFRLASHLDRKELSRDLGLVQYSQLYAKRDMYANRAQFALVQINTMDAGLGTNVKRERYLRETIKKKPGASGEVALGAKGTDLHFEIKLSGKNPAGEETNEVVSASIAEIKFLRVISDRNKYKHVVFHPLVSDESEQSYEDFLNQIYLPDRIDQTIPNDQKRTYRQIAAELDIEIAPSFLQRFYPNIDAENGKLTVQRTAPGNHGQLGFHLILNILKRAGAAVNTLQSKAKTVIQVFNNGDNVSSMIDNVIAGWMIAERVPMVMITTDKAPIDKKGGQIGLEILPNGKVRVQILEERQAKNAGQTDIFYANGLEPNGNRQAFNTNVLALNETLLAGILQDLVAHVGRDEFLKLMSPDLITNPKEGKEGKKYIQLEGAIASVLMNLDAVFSASDDPNMQKILKKHKVKKMLRIVNVDYAARTDFFTPVKSAFDFWLQAYSDYYRLDTKRWKLKDNKTGNVPPEVSLDPYYEDVQNLIESFGNAGVSRLKSLSIKGKVNVKNMVLAGRIEIVNETDELVDLTDSKFAEYFDTHQIGAGESRFYLHDVKIVINRNGLQMERMRSELRMNAQFAREMMPHFVAQYELAMLKLNALIRQGADAAVIRIAQSTVEDLWNRYTQASTVVLHTKRSVPTHNKTPGSDINGKIGTVLTSNKYSENPSKKVRAELRNQLGTNVVFFDFGGVLAGERNDEFSETVTTALLARSGVSLGSLPDQDFQTLKGMVVPPQGNPLRNKLYVDPSAFQPWYQSIRDFLTKLGARNELTINAFKEVFYGARTSNMALELKSKQLRDIRKKGVRLGVVVNFEEQGKDQLLAFLDDHYKGIFDPALVFVSAELGSQKGKGREFFDKVLKRFEEVTGGKAQNPVLIDNDAAAFDGAREAGFKYLVHYAKDEGRAPFTESQILDAVDVDSQIPVLKTLAARSELRSDAPQNTFLNKRRIKRAAWLFFVAALITSVPAYIWFKEYHYDVAALENAQPRILTPSEMQNRRPLQSRSELRIFFDNPIYGLLTVAGISLALGVGISGYMRLTHHSDDYSNLDFGYGSFILGSLAFPVVLFAVFFASIPKAPDTQSNVPVQIRSLESESQLPIVIPDENGGGVSINRSELRIFSRFEPRSGISHKRLGFVASLLAIGVIILAEFATSLMHSSKNKRSNGVVVLPSRDYTPTEIANHPATQKILKLLRNNAQGARLIITDESSDLSISVDGQVIQTILFIYNSDQELSADVEAEMEKLAHELMDAFSMPVLTGRQFPEEQSLDESRSELRNELLVSKDGRTITINGKPHTVNDVLDAVWLLKRNQISAYRDPASDNPQGRGVLYYDDGLNPIRFLVKKPFPTSRSELRSAEPQVQVKSPESATSPHMVVVERRGIYQIPTPPVVVEKRKSNTRLFIHNLHVLFIRPIFDPFLGALASLGVFPKAKKGYENPAKVNSRSELRMLALPIVIAASAGAFTVLTGLAAWLVHFRPKWIQQRQELERSKNEFSQLRHNFFVTFTALNQRGAEGDLKARQFAAGLLKFSPLIERANQKVISRNLEALPPLLQLIKSHYIQVQFKGRTAPEKIKLSNWLAMANRHLTATYPKPTFKKPEADPFAEEQVSSRAERPESLQTPSHQSNGKQSVTAAADRSTNPRPSVEARYIPPSIWGTDWLRGGLAVAVRAELRQQQEGDLFEGRLAGEKVDEIVDQIITEHKDEGYERLTITVHYGGQVIAEAHDGDEYMSLGAAVDDVLFGQEDAEYLKSAQFAIGRTDNNIFLSREDDDGGSQVVNNPNPSPSGLKAKAEKPSDVDSSDRDHNRRGGLTWVEPEPELGGDRSELREGQTLRDDLTASLAQSKLQVNEGVLGEIEKIWEAIQELHQVNKNRLFFLYQLAAKQVPAEWDKEMVEAIEDFQVLHGIPLIQVKRILVEPEKTAAEQEKEGAPKQEKKKEEKITAVEFVNSQSLPKVSLVKFLIRATVTAPSAEKITLRSPFKEAAAAKAAASTDQPKAESTNDASIQFKLDLKVRKHIVTVTLGGRRTLGFVLDRVIAQLVPAENLEAVKADIKSGKIKILVTVTFKDLGKKKIAVTDLPLDERAQSQEIFDILKTIFSSQSQTFPAINVLGDLIENNAVQFTITDTLKTAALPSAVSILKDEKAEPRAKETALKTLADNALKAFTAAFTEIGANPYPAERFRAEMTVGIQAITDLARGLSTQDGKLWLAGFKYADDKLQELLKLTAKSKIESDNLKQLEKLAAQVHELSKKLQERWQALQTQHQSTSVGQAEVELKKDIQSVSKNVQELNQQIISALKDFRDEVAARAELRIARELRIAEDDLSVQIKIGTSGWRATTAQSGAHKDAGFNVDNVGRFAQAAADVLKSEPRTQARPIRVAVGYDARRDANFYAKDIVQILAANGIHTDLIDQITPTPVVAEATRGNLPPDVRYDYAFHVTASHNPVYRSLNVDDDRWLGIKILANGVPANDQLTSKIAARANDTTQNASYKLLPIEEIPAELTTKNVNLLEASNDRLRKAFDIDRLKLLAQNYLSNHSDFGVLVDSMGGATVDAAKIFSELGIVKAHLNITPIREGKHPIEVDDPQTGKKTLWSPEPRPLFHPELSAQIKPGQLGLVFDGDGDRAAVVDIDGKTAVTPNELGLIFAHYLYHVRGERGAVVRTLPTTRSLDRFAKRNGLNLRETPVGSKHFEPYAVHDSKEEKLLVAVEESGHIFFQLNGEIFADSAIAEGLLILEIITSTGKSLTEYLQQIYAEQGTLVYRRSAVDKTIATDEFVKALPNVKQAHAKDFALALSQKLGKTLKPGQSGEAEEGVTFNSKDTGVLVVFADDTWAMYRLSGTDGSVRLYGEESTEERLLDQEKILTETLVEFVGRSELRSVVETVHQDIAEAEVKLEHAKAAWAQAVEKGKKGAILSALVNIAKANVALQELKLKHMPSVSSPDGETYVNSVQLSAATAALTNAQTVLTEAEKALREFALAGSDHLRPKSELRQSRPTDEEFQELNGEDALNITNTRLATLTEAHAAVSAVLQNNPDLRSELRRSSTADQIIKSETKQGWVISRSAAFDQGLAPYYVAIAARSEIRIGFVTPTRSELRFVEDLNAALPLNKQILYAATPEKLARLLRSKGIRNNTYFTDSSREADIVRSELRDYFTNVIFLSSDIISGIRSRLGEAAKKLDEFIQSYRIVLSRA